MRGTLLRPVLFARVASASPALGQSPAPALTAADLNAWLDSVVPAVGGGPGP